MNPNEEGKVHRVITARTGFQAFFLPTSFSSHFDLGWTSSWKGFCLTEHWRHHVLFPKAKTVCWRVASECSWRAGYNM